MFVDIRDTEGKLLFRFDPWRDLIEIQRRRKKEYVDLSAYRPAGWPVLSGSFTLRLSASGV